MIADYYQTQTEGFAKVPKAYSIRNYFKKLEVSVKTNVPVDFELTLQPFKGFDPVKFMVSICLETQGQTVVCYLESIQALEYFEAQKDKIFDEQLQVFKQDGIAIIEQ